MEGRFHLQIKFVDGTTYVTIPQESDPGAPATVATITDQTGSGGPLLRPFPDWDWYKGGGCYDIINVYSIKIICNHIFVMDTGKIGTNKICDPKLLVFDLLKKNSDALVDSVFFPSEIAANKTGAGSLVSPVVYIPGQSVSGCSRFNDRIVSISSFNKTFNSDI
ncbi:PREDICTED: major royal jelly protein 3-like, partial [Wasmannia auropunctata]|uniref:major royal jelly protein 3-like n=1 Tax=Wasmannia auropunctata TaxID=64793 RepID=UPI0005EF94CA